jgi:hypothetical protein
MFVGDIPESNQGSNMEFNSRLNNINIMMNNKATKQGKRGTVFLFHLRNESLANSSLKSN